MAAGRPLADQLVNRSEQTVADGLGVMPNRVFINATDTATYPWDVGTHASRGAFMACSAALLSIEKIRERLPAFCAEGFAELLRKNIQSLSKKEPSFEPPTLDIDATCRPDNFDMLTEPAFYDLPSERMGHASSLRRRARRLQSGRVERAGQPERVASEANGHKPRRNACVDP